MIWRDGKRERERKRGQEERCRRGRWIWWMIWRDGKRERERKRGKEERCRRGRWIW